MEDKKWYWESLSMIHKQQTEYMSWFDEFIVVKRRDYIKLIHSKLYTEAETSSSIRIFAPGSAYTLKIMNNNGDYDMEICGDIQIITNIIKELIRDIKLTKIGI